jgi:ketosteroid isomerase-like protein
MSANLDLVRSIYADWERGDFSSVGWADPELEFVIADGPDAGSWKGLAAVGQAWRDLLAALANHHTEAGEYRELEQDRVLWIGDISTRGKGSGLDLRSQVANLFEIRAGKVVRLVLWWDADRALADLGPELVPG